MVWRVVLVVDFSGQDSGIKSIEFDVMLLFQFSSKYFGVELFDLLEERVGLLEEIVTYEWDGCSSDGVMMLEDTQVLEHLSLAGDNLLGVVFVIRDGMLGLKSQRGMKLGTSQFDHSLNMRFGSEETTPVLVGVLGIWEGVISSESETLGERLWVLWGGSNKRIVCLFNSLHELLGIRVNKFDVWVDGVPMLDNSIKEEVVNLSLGE